MPGPTTPSMNLILPALGGDAGTWSDELNTALTLVDGHTHEPGKGVKVPTAGLNINADLSLAGNGLANIKSLAFTEIAALTAGADTIFVSAADHELYWRSAAGVNVKLTSGSALNVAAFAGGIGGDYSAVGAAVNYDAANTRYTFQGASPTFNWSILASGDLRLYQAGTTESVYTGIQVAPGLASNYNIVLPTALPSGNRPVYLDNTGTLSTSAGMTRIGRQVITASGTYPQTAGTRSVLLRLVSGGGGGGGAAGGTGSSAGGGGCSGVFVEKWIASAVSAGGYVATIGAGGSGGANTGGNGGTGGATTVVIGATTYQADGGGGGAGMAASTESVASGGVWNIAYSYGPDDYLCVQPGQVGVNVGGTSFLAVSGAGGSTPLGAGGFSQAIHTGSSSLAGVLGIGYGGGGGGAVMYGSDATGAAGGAGASGLIIIDEFM